MPPAALRAMIDDVSRAGGVVVLRGLPQNSAKALTAALRESRAARRAAGERRHRPAPVPRVRYRGGARPMSSPASDFDLCDGFDCRTAGSAARPHERQRQRRLRARDLRRAAAAPARASPPSISPDSKGRSHETASAARRWRSLALACCPAGVAHAQTTTDAAKADGKAFGRDKAAAAQDAATHRRPMRAGFPISAARRASRTISTIPTG